MITKKIRQIRRKLKDDYIIGPFAKTCDPGFVEIMGHAGWDFVIIDLEHGPNSVQTAQNLIRGAHIADTLPIARVKENAPSIIGEVLDIGAGGIHVPQITNAEAARQVIELAKFAPQGMRGVCRFVRAADYSAMDKFKYFKEANEAIIIVGLEGTEALRNVDEIMAVKGVDIIFIGPYDLSQSLGVTGQIGHPLVTEKMMEMCEKCVKKGVAVGTFAETIEDARKWKDLGVKYITYAVDTGIFYEACRNIVQGIQAD